MAGGPKPPEVALVTVVLKAEHLVAFTGKTSDGEHVAITLHGDTSYFLQGEKFKITFDPL